MEDVVTSENYGDFANQLGDDSYGLEEIVDPVDEFSRVTREDLVSLDFKCGSAGITVPGTPAEIIALETEGLDVRASSSLRNGCVSEIFWRVMDRVQQNSRMR